MGVKGLTSYLKKKGYRPDTKLFSLTGRNKYRLVVDVASLIYFIYNHHCNWVMAGDYSNLKAVIRSYVMMINLMVGWDGKSSYTGSNEDQLCGLGLVVWVLDGVSDKSKENTIISRFNDKLVKLKGAISNPKSYSEYERPHYFIVKPLLCERLFIEVLKEYDQSVAMAYLEADDTMVYLANRLEASILGIDSDFFIYDIPDGYIDLNCLQGVLSSLVDLKTCSSYQEAIYIADSGRLTLSFLMPCYFKSQISKFLNVRSDQLALVATLIGTDKTVGLFDINHFRRKLNSRSKYVDPIKLALDYVHQFCCNIHFSVLFQQLEHDFRLSPEQMDLVYTSLNSYQTPTQDPQLRFKFLVTLPPNVEDTIRRAYKQGNLNYRNLAILSQAQFFGSPLLESSSMSIPSCWFLTNQYRYQFFHIATCPPSHSSQQQQEHHYYNHSNQHHLRCIYPAGDIMTLADPMSASNSFQGIPLERVMKLHSMLHAKIKLSPKSLLVFLLKFMCGQLLQPIVPTKLTWEVLPSHFALVLACVFSIINYNHSYFPARELNRSVRGYWLMYAVLSNMSGSDFPIPSLPQAQNSVHQTNSLERPTLPHYKFPNLMQTTLLAFEPFLVLFGFADHPKVRTEKFMDVPVFLECVKIIDRTKVRLDNIQSYLIDILGSGLGNTVFKDYVLAASYTDPMLK